MSVRLLVLGVAIVSSVTVAYGYSLEAGNTASYWMGGPPAAASSSVGVGSFQTGGYVGQQAATFVPNGFGYVDQGTWMTGVQASGWSNQEQAFRAGMGQTAYKQGGSGYAYGAQVGSASMNQTTARGVTAQGAGAIGVQMSMVYGGLGNTGTASQTAHVSTGQAQIH
ncbi:MAG: hypothetical protein JW955_04190 [Sedimentisphaerales bacterium]|nr:hypothetical protein [Sedimentisphaerales bacterium]